MKFFSLIHHGEVHAETKEKVIPAESFSTLKSAHEILELAKQEAIQYKAEIEKECEALKEAAQKEGFDAGLAKFNEHLLNFDRQLRLLKIDLQKQILPLALKAAKKIVGKELSTHPETIVEIVRQSLEPIAHNQRYTIYVNKADKDILETNKPRLKEILEHVKTLTIQERADISPGGCIIETETGIINATIENQYRAIETAFERYMKQ